MEKVDSFRITELSMSGFKCFSKPQTFRFGGMNAITGHNGQGKTSIAEAISYAITGVPFFGSEQSLDRLYTVETKDMQVALTIELPDGTAHQLVRTRIKDNTDIIYDGIPIRQSDLTIMFGEKDVFLSIFNPLYFIEQLGDKGRNLLERYLPAVPNEKVMEKLSEGEQALLENVQMHSPEAFLEKVRSDIRELESNIIYVEGQRDLLSTQSRESQSTLAQKQADLTAAMLRADELDSKRTSGLDIPGMKDKLADLYARYDEMARDRASLPDTAEIDEELINVSRILEERRAAVFVSPYAQAAAETKARFEQAKSRYNQENTIMAGIKPGVRCPQCKQEVTEQNFGAVKQSFADSVNALMEEGRALKGQLDEIADLEAKALDVFEQYKADDIAKLVPQVADLQDRRETLLKAAEDDASGHSATMEHIKGEIQTLELDIEMGNLTEAEVRELDGIRSSISEMETEIKVLAVTQSTATPEEKESNLDSLRRMIAEKRELEAAVKFYISERVKLRFSDFDMLQRAEVLLYDVVKTTGEVKDCWKFSYDGRPYRYLSLSEKIKAGLELSELMKKLTRSEYPVFIDNGESVPIIDNIRPSGQVFISQVVKAAPLTVQILDGPAQNTQKAAA